MDVNLQTILAQKNMTMYRLSKISGVPKTTILDICSGKSSIEGCNAKTVYMLAKALECPMETLMIIDSADYEQDTGLQKDSSYLEKGLPEYLQISLDNMKKSWEIEDSGGTDLHWDLYWCELNADINSAEVDRVISAEQANYLRKVYLRMKEDD
jgi:transcriptional regulator with XRE-family HTH domain